MTFGMSTLYQSGIVSWGLIGAAGLAAIVIALLVIGASERELRGAGLAAGLAAFVLLVPLLLALLGHDDYLARGLIPAWIPLAIVIGAACTTAWRPGRGRRAGGRAAGAVRLRGGQDRLQTRSSSRALTGAGSLRRSAGRAQRGRSSPTTGSSPTGPLSVYLPGVPWSGPGGAPQGTAPVSVSRARHRGRPHTAPVSPALRGAADRIALVDGYRVVRMRFGNRPWRLTPAAIGARARSAARSGAAGRRRC